MRIRQFKIQLKYILIITLLCGLSFLCYSITIQIRQKKLIESKIQTLPQFNLKDIFNNDFNSSYINNNNSCLIIYFHPECDHCHYEAEQICLNIDQFYNSQIVMISPASRESVEDFVKNNHLLEFDNITILIDTLDGFHDIFGHNPFPTSFIYNKEKKLVKQFKGEVTTEALLNYLNQ